MQGSELVLSLIQNGKYPVDGKTIAPSVQHVKDNLPDTARFEGLFIYCIDEVGFYSFQGGITNDDFRPCGGGSVKELPEYLVTDKNKILSINEDGNALVWIDYPKELPEIVAGDKDKILVVNATEDGVEWKDSGIGDLTTLTTTTKDTLVNAINEVDGEVDKKINKPLVDGSQDNILSLDADGNTIWVANEKELPAYTTTEADKILSVSSDGTTIEWIENKIGDLTETDNIVQDLSTTSTDTLLSTDGLKIELDKKIDKPLTNGLENDILSLDADGNVVWVENPKELPTIATGDAGKYLAVNQTEDGYELVEETKELPEYLSTDNDKMLKVKADGTGLEWGTPQGGVPVYTIDDAEKVLTVNVDGTDVVWAESGSGGSADWISNTSCGALQSGSDLSGMSPLAILKAITVAYVNPTATIVYSQTNTIIEKGQTFNLDITANSVSEGTNSVDRLELYKDGILTETISFVAGTTSYSFTTISDVSVNVNIEIRVYDTSSKYGSYTKKYKFVSPYYVGSLDDVPNETTLISLTKLIEDKTNKTRSITCANQHVIFAYPNSYGVLNSILDGNGFENIQDYIMTTLAIDTVVYNVYYTIGKKTLADFTYVYKY
jgi:hypothetical protein